MLQRTRTLAAKAGARLQLTVTLWRRSLALVVIAAPQLALAMTVLMLLQAFLPVGTLWASRGVVNAAARALGVVGPAVGGPAQVPLSLWIALAVGLTLLLQNTPTPAFRGLVITVFWPPAVALALLGPAVFALRPELSLYVMLWLVAAMLLGWYETATAVGAPLQGNMVGQVLLATHGGME